jgi:hypothetical protein
MQIEAGKKVLVTCVTGQWGSEFFGLLPIQQAVIFRVAIARHQAPQGVLGRSECGKNDHFHLMTASSPLAPALTLSSAETPVARFADQWS